jgi:hypothetical protein
MSMLFCSPCDDDGWTDGWMDARSSQKKGAGAGPAFLLPTMDMYFCNNSGSSEGLLHECEQLSQETKKGKYFFFTNTKAKRQTASAPRSCLGGDSLFQLSNDPF